MDDQSRQIIKAMVEMAWADGHASPEESSLLVRALQEAGANPNDVEEFGKLLSRPNDGEAAQIDPSHLDPDKRLSVMRALLIMSFMDGHVSFAEYSQIERWQKELEIAPEQMEILRAEALAAADTISATS
jgi:uncharacterized tellurite resistance protein B-like protein